MSGKILVVEDNPATRKMVRVTLAGAGYTVFEAPDGRTALQLIGETAPDVVLQDLLLPDADGFDLVARLRAEPAGATVPIIAFSGFLSRLEAGRASAAGFTDFLIKPVEPSRLLHAVETYLPRHDSATHKPGRGWHVLVVDDDPIQLKLARVHLDLLGFRVSAASDGAEALEVALRVSPDVILSDVLMPRLDGFELCLAARRDPRLTRIPVVLNSVNYVEEADRRLARRAGASDLIVRTPDFRATAEVLLRSLAVGPPPTPTEQVEVLKAEHVLRVARQLERQVGTNAGLLQRASLQAAVLSMLAGLADTLAQPVDVAPTALLASILDAGGISMGALYLLGPDGRRLSLQAQTGWAVPAEGDPEVFFGHPELLATTLESGRTTVIPSPAVPEATAQDFLGRAKVASVVIVPLASRGARHGLLMVASNRRDLSDRDWLAFAQTMALQVAQTLALSRAFTNLTAAEEKYRALFENAVEGIYQATPDGRVILANPALARILGYGSAAELTAAGTDFARHFDVDPSRRAALMRLIAEHGVVSSFELQASRRDGSVIWISVSARAVPDAREAQGRYEGRVEDITARKHAEEATRMLADVGRVLSQSLDHREVARRIVDSVQTLLSARIAVVYRLEPESGALVVLAVAGDALLAPDDVLPRGTGVVGLAVRERGPVVTPHFRADPRVTLPPAAGTRTEGAMDRAVLAVPLLLQDQVIGALGIGDHAGRLFDDREIRLAQAFADQAAVALQNARLYEEARASRDFLQSIASNSVDAIVTTDIHGRITYFSPGAEEILGYRAEEILGRHAAELYRAGIEEARAVMHRLRSDGRARGYETVFRAKDGRSIDVSASISLLRDATGAVTGTLAVMQDVTLRRQAEDQIRRQRDALAQTEKLAAMGQLLAGVAHELNNPLSVVLGQAALLHQAAYGGRLADRAEKITQAAERCGRIVRNFLALARQRPPERQEVRLNEVVREAAELLGYSLLVDSVTVTLDLAIDLPLLWADPHQLHQVVLNLVTNAHHAMRATDPPRRLTLATRFDPGEGRVCLTVTDSGPGISPEVQSRLFEPFFTTKPLGQGTGIGLSLCQGIVEGHGGTIRVESAPGQGATVRVELPILAPRPAAEAPVATAALPTTGTILVVDDERDVAEVLAEMLMDDGHDVDMASSGRVALDRLRERAYDLILSDIRMPDLDGPSLYREVERHSPDLSRRIVFLTGDTLSAEITAFLEETRAPSVSKPFTVDEIRRAVRQILRPD